MKMFLFSLLIAVSHALFSQSSVVIYSEGGEQFSLSVNGRLINDLPQSRVRAANLSEDFIQARIDFETPGAPTLNKGVMTEPGMETTLVVKKNPKGKYVLRLVSSAPIQQQAVEEKEVAKVPQVIEEPAQPSPSSTAQTTTMTTTTTTVPNENVGISVSAGGETFNMSFNMGGTNDQQETTTTQTVVTSQTSSSENSTSSSSIERARVSGNDIILDDGKVYRWKHIGLTNRLATKIKMVHPAGASVRVSYNGGTAFEGTIPFNYDEYSRSKSNEYVDIAVYEPNKSWTVKLRNKSGHILSIYDPIIINQQYKPGNTTNSSKPLVVEEGCSNPMSASSFSRAQQSISGKAFEDEKMTVFKQVIKNNCVSVNQVIAFMNQFTYEEEKLQVAKLAYPQTINKSDYYQVNDGLTYSDSIEELNAFLERQ